MLAVLEHQQRRHAPGYRDHPEQRNDVRMLEKRHEGGLAEQVRPCGGISARLECLDRRGHHDMPAQRFSLEVRFVDLAEVSLRRRARLL